MSHLRFPLGRTLRTIVLAVLVAGLTAVAPAPAHAASAPAGASSAISPQALAAACSRLRGKYTEDSKSQSYRCKLPDGSIDCTAKGQCVFKRLGDKPPLEVTCEKAGGIYFHDTLVNSCSIKEFEVSVLCEKGQEVCGTVIVIPNEQPMP